MLALLTQRRYATSGVKQGLVSELGHRLGRLNIFNPMHCDGFYRLDLGKRDQRMVAQMLVVLSLEEPGENVGAGGRIYCAFLCPANTPDASAVVEGDIQRERLRAAAIMDAVRARARQRVER